MTERVALLVVGAGPAGLAAARTALNLGVDTVLLDEQSSVGGQIYRAVERVSPKQRDVLGEDYAAGAHLAAVRKLTGLDYRPYSTVWEVTVDGVVYYSSAGRAQAVTAQQVLLCTGALERPMPIPGWTLPGVMTCGAAQILLKGSGIVPAGQVVLAGSGPLLLLLASQLLAAGTQLAAVVETTPAANYRSALRYFPGALKAPGYLRKGLALVRALKRSRVPWYKSATALEVLGDDAVQGLRFRDRGGARELDCDTLLLHQGVVPNVQLSRSLGLEHDWDSLQRCWRPLVDDWGATALSPVAISGDSAGIMGAIASGAHGQLAALGALERLGVITATERDQKAGRPRRQYEHEIAPRPFLDQLYQPHSAYLTPADGTIVCRCEEVTAGEIRAFVELGCLGPNQTKAFGRPGMGPCQGRVCGLVVSEIIAQARGVSPEAVGYYRIRSPVKPVTLGELAAMEFPEERIEDHDAA